MHLRLYKYVYALITIPNLEITVYFIYNCTTILSVSRGVTIAKNGHRILAYMTTKVRNRKYDHKNAEIHSDNKVAQRREDRQSVSRKS
jgi:hypothetical protein